MIHKSSLKLQIKSELWSAFVNCLAILNESLIQKQISLLIMLHWHQNVNKPINQMELQNKTIQILTA